MSTNEHPVTPPSELIRELWDKHRKAPDAGIDAATAWRQVITHAAQWGADMELKACCDWLEDTDCEDPQEVANHLRAARRPKPPSLKEEALEALEQIDGYAIDQLSAYTIHKELKQYANTIRRALESLPND